MGKAGVHIEIAGEAPVFRVAVLRELFVLENVRDLLIDQLNLLVFVEEQSAIFPSQTKTMKFIGVLAALANRHRPVLVNGGVGFATFAAGDALSQGARSTVVMGSRNMSELSWQQQFAERCVTEIVVLY